jgi:L-fuculose-phosphate aldolase
MTNSTEAESRTALVDAYREVVARGLTDQASGNVSCRIPGGMLISCSGATARNLTPERVVAVTRDGTWQSDEKPSSEWRMHLAIYRQHEDANAVVHTHSDHCVAVSCQREALPGFHYMVGTLGGTDVPCVPYSTFGTEQLAQDAANALTHRHACLLASHGMIARGPDLAAAIDYAERLEILCRHYLLARQLGEPPLLSDAEWQDFFQRMDEVAYGKTI